MQDASSLFLAIALLSPTLGAASETFDGASLGNLSSIDWTETTNQPSQNLFQVVNSQGVSGSKGASLNTGPAESSYRIINQAGESGSTYYEVSAKFKMTIGNGVPSSANHAVFGVRLSNSVDGGQGISVNLSRRNSGKSYGVNGIGDPDNGFEAWRVKGWEDNSEIGLPNSLPGSTATSDWFEIRLAITPTGNLDAQSRPLWNVLGEIRDDSDSVVYSLLVPNRPITTNGNNPSDPAATAIFAPGDTIYGGVEVAWVTSNTFNTLAQGEVEGLVVDDFSLEAPSPPIPVLPPHAITSNPATQDLDNNGLPDVWEALYKAKGLDPASDSDGDGQSNADEAALGTNPFDPQSGLSLRLQSTGRDTAMAAWSYLPERPGILESSTDLGKTNPWDSFAGSPTLQNGEWTLDLATTDDARFFRVRNSSNDLDSDGVPDWMEIHFSFQKGSGNEDSASLPRSYDTTGDGSTDTSLSGDLAAFNEIYRRSEAGTAMTRAQAARLLIQGSFGPTSPAEVDYVAGIGAEAWIDEQIAKPASLTRPYIDAIKQDLANGQNDSSLQGYNVNNGGTSSAYIAGTNYPTAWIRTTVNAEDQLRQRVAFALSQIMVASRGGAMLANQPRAIATYYDNFINKAFGNYEDILLDVSLSPVMGIYLSHLRNEKADTDINRYPDENYAREIMQLFTIGLFELNPDGSQKLDLMGNPIPTYDNGDITALAEVFTGLNYDSGNFFNGYRDDGEEGYMTSPMKVYESHHDFTSKDIPIGVDANGNRLHHTIPARAENDANALQDVEDVVYQLVRHPNTAPFVCRQLIQFLVSSNPSPEFVGRVSAIFSNNGSGVVGDLEAVVKAILLDEEARDPMEHLSTPYFGHFREPLVRLVHLARLLELGRHNNLLWWDWGYYKEQSLQEPMHAPSVFNYYRPDFRLFGTLAENELDSPALGIVNSYSAISFNNYLWRMCEDGFRHPNGNQFYDGQTFPPDYSSLTPLAANIPALLDHLSLLYCAGTLGAESRDIIAEVLAAEPDTTDRARLAAFLVLISSEGSCLK